MDQVLLFDIEIVVSLTKLKYTIIRNVRHLSQIRVTSIEVYLNFNLIDLLVSLLHDEVHHLLDLAIRLILGHFSNSLNLTIWTERESARKINSQVSVVFSFFDGLWKGHSLTLMSCFGFSLCFFYGSEITPRFYQPNSSKFNVSFYMKHFSCDA